MDPSSLSTDPARVSSARFAQHSFSKLSASIQYSGVGTSPLAKRSASSPVVPRLPKDLEPLRGTRRAVVRAYDLI
jgi:hypothetical protein